MATTNKIISVGQGAKVRVSLALVFIVKALNQYHLGRDPIQGSTQNLGLFTNSQNFKQTSNDQLRYL